MSVFIAVNGNETLFRMLAKDRFQVIVSESVMGERIINGNAGYKGIVEIDQLQEIEIYSYIHRKHRALGEKITATLERMKQDGSFAQLNAEAIANFVSQ